VKNSLREIVMKKLLMSGLLVLILCAGRVYAAQGGVEILGVTVHESLSQEDVTAVKKAFQGGLERLKKIDDFEESQRVKNELNKAVIALIPYSSHDEVMTMFVAITDALKQAPVGVVEKGTAQQKQKEIENARSDEPELWPLARLEIIEEAFYEDLKNNPIDKEDQLRKDINVIATTDSKKADHMRHALNKALRKAKRANAQQNNVEGA
jgi:hypothetical protein